MVRRALRTLPIIHRRTRNLTYATLNRNAYVYAWLRGLLQSERVPLVSVDPADLDVLAGFSDEVSYVAALDRLTREKSAGRPLRGTKRASTNGNGGFVR